MHRLKTIALLGLFILFGCGQTGTVTDGARGGDRDMVSPAAAESSQSELADVMIDGVSVLGAWNALEIIGDEQATADLNSGIMKMTLLIQPNGRATLTGIDNREGTGNVRFNGRISGNQLALDGLEGSATLFMSGRRLILRDPRGRSTVYIRGVDG
ncbi:MAG: hypothetical protein R3284_03360 [Rubricoccaceae bacterium]|nr:hypothetical protein [Rubricoccaceae bacterium]